MTEHLVISPPIPRELEELRQRSPASSLRDLERVQIKVATGLNLLEKRSVQE